MINEIFNDIKIRKIKYKKNSISNLYILVFVIIYIISFILIIINYVIYKYIIIERDKYLNNLNISIENLNNIKKNYTNKNNKIYKIKNEIKNLHLILDKYKINNTNIKEKHNKIRQINKNLKGKNSYIKIESYSSILKYNDFIKISQYLKNILITNYCLNETQEFYPIFDLKYKASLSGCNSESFLPYVIDKNNILIVIKTKENNIFGAFYHNKIILKYNKKKLFNNNLDFMFNLNLDDYFPAKKNRSHYWFNKLMTFNIGKHDIFIPDDCLNNSFSLCKFPFSFNITKNNLNKYINYNKTKFKNINHYLNFKFCGKKTNFKIVEIEIYNIELEIN